MPPLPSRGRVWFFSPFDLGWPWDLLWSTECDGSDTLPIPGLHPKAHSSTFKPLLKKLRLKHWLVWGPTKKALEDEPSWKKLPTECSLILTGPLSWAQPPIGELEIINSCCFKQLRFKVVCYTALENQNMKHPLPSLSGLPTVPNQYIWTISYAYFLYHHFCL